MTGGGIKSALTEFTRATRAFDLSTSGTTVAAAFAQDATIHMCAPFGDLIGGTAFLETCLAPLATALPDLERRDIIVTAGTTPEGQDWVGCMGNYMGTFLAPFLDIRPTGHLAHMVDV